MDNQLMTKEEQAILVAKGQEIVGLANLVTITDNESYEHAGEFLKDLKERRDEVMAKPLEKKQDAHGVWKFLNDICNAVKKPFDDAESILDRKMLGYRQEIERKRREEIAKAEAKAREKAEAERKAEIARMKELGDKEAAKNLKAAPIQVQAVAPKTPEAPKISGVTVRKIWKYQIDIDKLERKYMMPDDATIGKLVRALGAKHGIAGVTVWQEECQ